MARLRVLRSSASDALGEASAEGTRFPALRHGSAGNHLTTSSSIPAGLLVVLSQRSDVLV